MLSFPTIPGRNHGLHTVSFPVYKSICRAQVQPEEELRPEETILVGSCSFSILSAPRLLVLWKEDVVRSQDPG